MLSILGFFLVVLLKRNVSVHVSDINAKTEC